MLSSYIIERKKKEQNIYFDIVIGGAKLHVYKGLMCHYLSGLIAVQNTSVSGAFFNSLLLMVDLMVQKNVFRSIQW